MKLLRSLLPICIVAVAIFCFFLAVAPLPARAEEPGCNIGSQACDFIAGQYEGICDGPDGTGWGCDCFDLDTGIDWGGSQDCWYWIVD